METARVIDITDTTEETMKTEVLAIPDKAKLITVVDQASFDAADRFFGIIKDMEKKIDAFFDPMIEAAMETKRKAEAARKAVVTRRDEVKAPLVDASNYLRPQMYAWTKKQEEERRLEQLRLEAQARKEEEERRLREAELLEQMGEHEEAERVIEEPVIFQAPVAQKVSAPSNFIAKENWQFEIVDIDKLPRKYMVPDETMIRAEVKRMKGKTNIPGVRAYDIGTVARKGR